MSIFQEMFDQKRFSWPDEYEELLRKLSEAIERGFVEEIPNTWKGIYRHSRWFREKSTGVVYALDQPEAPARGSWRELTAEEMFPDATIAPIGRLPN
jgi:hypothetical protein